MIKSNERKVKLIGIAGASGSGKSFFAQLLQRRLTLANFILSQDDYYKDRSDLSLAARQAINYDHPDALDFDLLVEHLKVLKKGLSIQHPQYDFSIHNRKVERTQAGPAPIVLVDGILIYAVKECRELFDFKVYVQTPLDICFIRRLQRDMKERGRTIESVTEQYLNTVRPMFLQFVEPTAQYAHLVVQGIGTMQQDAELVLQKIME